MKPILATLLIAAIMFTTAPLLTAADATAGKTLFAKKCASCHGPVGEGNEKIAAMFKVEMRHLGSKEVQAKTDSELKKDILEGNGKMKPVKDVNEKAAEDLVTYLRSLAKK